MRYTYLEKFGVYSPLHKFEKPTDYEREKIYIYLLVAVLGFGALTIDLFANLFI